MSADTAASLGDKSGVAAGSDREERGERATPWLVFGLAAAALYLGLLFGAGFLITRAVHSMRAETDATEVASRNFVPSRPAPESPHPLIAAPARLAQPAVATTAATAPALPAKAPPPVAPPAPKAKVVPDALAAAAKRIASMPAAPVAQPKPQVAVAKPAGIAAASPPAEPALAMTRSAAPAPPARPRPAPSPPLAAPPAPVAPAPRNPVETAAAASLVAVGDQHFQEGDVASARLYYQRAAALGDGTGALRLGNSYDPAFLVRLGVQGMAGDSTQAARWYRQAAALGQPDAKRALASVAAP